MGSPLRPCGVCRKPAPNGNCPKHPKKGGYRPNRPSVVSAVYGPNWGLVREMALRRDNYRCRYCGGPGRTGDHVVPHSRGGISQLDNTLTACARCNTSKGNRTLTEWVHSGLAPAHAAVLLAERILARLPV